MSKLEKFIRNNREEFDMDEPSNELWGKIQRELRPEIKLKPLRRGLNYWKIAAVILLLISSALLVDKWIGMQQKAPVQAEKYFTDEFKEAEHFYMQLAAEKKAILEKKCKDDPQYKAEFLSEINDLDNQYKQLKDDLKYGNQDEIMDAMVVNLQLRIEILNRQLEIIESINKKEKNDENINI